MFGRRETQLNSIIDFNSQIFAVERQNHRITSIIYGGKNRVRRISFTLDQKTNVDWEFSLSDLDFCGRFDDLMLLPGQNKGLRAIDIISGATRWEIGHPSVICKPLYQDGGSAFSFFQDQVWLELDPKTGEIRNDGKLSNENELQSFRSNKQRLVPQTQREVYLQNGQISVRFDTLYVEGTSNQRAPAIALRCPTKGEYPIDGWQPDGGLCITEGKLAAWLKRTWSGRHHTAVGFFELPSLTPSYLVQLGENKSSGSCTNFHIVDGLLFAGGNIKQPNNESDYTAGKYLIDPTTESLIAVFMRNHNSIFFYNEEPYWWGAL